MSGVVGRGIPDGPWPRMRVVINPCSLAKRQHHGAAPRPCLRGWSLVHSKTSMGRTMGKQSGSKLGQPKSATALLISS